MVRVTAFLRVSLLSTALAATLLASQAATAAGPAQPGGGPNAGPQIAQGHGGQGHGGQAGTRSGDKQAGPATAPQPTTPAAGCLKPGVPLCMDDRDTFVSADRMSSCQGEVKEYVDKTMAYLNCLNDENIATGRELSRNVDRFNCRLSGRKGCAD